MRTIDDTIGVYIESRGNWLLGFAVHHLRPIERTNLADPSVCYLLWNYE